MRSEIRVRRAAEDLRGPGGERVSVLARWTAGIRIRGVAGPHLIGIEGTLPQSFEGQRPGQHLLLAVNTAPAETQAVLLPDPICRVHAAAAFPADLCPRLPAPARAQRLVPLARSVRPPPPVSARTTPFCLWPRRAPAPRLGRVRPPPSRLTHGKPSRLRVAGQRGPHPPPAWRPHVTRRCLHMRSAGPHRRVRNAGKAPTMGGRRGPATAGTARILIATPRPPARTRWRCRSSRRTSPSMALTAARPPGPADTTGKGTGIVGNRTNRSRCRVDRSTQN